MEDWPIGDPDGQPLERARQMRDDLGLMVAHLVSIRRWVRGLQEPLPRKAGSCAGAASAGVARGAPWPAADSAGRTPPALARILLKGRWGPARPGPDGDSYTPWRHRMKNLLWAGGLAFGLAALAGANEPDPTMKGLGGHHHGLRRGQRF